MWAPVSQVKSIAMLPVALWLMRRMENQNPFFNPPSSRARFSTPSAQVAHAFLSVVGRFAGTASRRRSGESG